MGIPRLTGKLAHYIRHASPDEFKGVDIVVDGCNFVHSGEEHFKTTGFLAIFKRNMAALEGLNPNSLTFYFDAAIPLEKIPVRVSRQKQLIAKTDWDHGFCFNELAIEELQTNYPQVKVILTGAEAEDYIMYDANSQKLDRKLFIFSSDSDCFTFSLAQADMVYLVAMREAENWPRTFITYQMSQVTRSAHVQARLHEPAVPPALKIEDVRFPFRRGQEFINTWKVYKKAIMFLPIIPAKVSDPYEIGLKWRQAAYAHYLQAHASAHASSPLPLKVDEYRQVDSQSRCIQVDLGKDEKLVNALSEDIVALVVRDITEFEGCVPQGLDEYLESLKSQPIPNIRFTQPPNRNTNALLALVVADILSIKMLALAHEIALEDHQLIWKINPDNFLSRA